MSIDNYFKLDGARFREEFFLFNSHSPASVETALAAARDAAGKHGRVSVYRQLTIHQENVTCVGHAPVYHIPYRGTWECANCGQVGTREIGRPLPVEGAREVNGTG
jgi:hypothetical protein